MFVNKKAEGAGSNLGINSRRVCNVIQNKLPLVSGVRRSAVRSVIIIVAADNGIL